MGATSSCSMGVECIGSVDKKITKHLFGAPLTEKYLLENLDDKNTKLYSIEVEKRSVSLIIITPPKLKYNKYVIFSHGNGCDIYIFSTYLKWFSYNYGVIAVSYDYPGYGLSEGKPSDKSCNINLTAVVQFISNITDQKNIILVGHSLGTGVVVDYIATHEWMNAVILISPYKSIPTVAYDSSSMNCLTKKYKFNSLKKMEKIKCPVKIFHGTIDNLINIRHGKALYEKLPNKSLAPVWMEGADHDNILNMINEKDILEVITYV